MFEPDPIWKSFTYGGCFEDYSKAHPHFVFRQGVSSTIREHMEDVHALLLHSFFRYRFLDIAHVRAMQVVEMALLVRCTELSSLKLQLVQQKKQKLRTPRLNELLDWAEKSGLIEETDDRPSWRKYDKKRIDVLRTIRNYSIHASPETLHGVVVVDLLYRVVDFINELYEDIEIRKRRHELERSIQRELNRIAIHGAILETTSIRLIVFHGEVLYAEPTVEGWNIYLGFLKIFTSQPNENETCMLPDPVFICASEHEVTDGTIRFKTKRNELVRFIPIADEANSSKFKSFLKEFSQNPILKPAVFQSLADQRINLKRYGY